MPHTEIDRSPRGPFREMLELGELGSPFAVLLVLRAAGSTPGRIAARAIVRADGSLSGTIGGGLVEAEACRYAVESLATGRTLVSDFDMAGEIVAGSDPICGGSLRVLIDPCADRHRAVYAAAEEALARRQAGVLLTAVTGPDPWRVAVQYLAEGQMPGEGQIPGNLAEPIGEALRQALARNQPLWVGADATVEPNWGEVLVEPLRPRPLLLIAGGGHVGQAVAWQADLVGFDVLVIDDRPEFTRLELFPPAAASRCGPIAEELARLPLDRDTYVVIVTRGHQSDAQTLAVCLGKPAAYVGMIGSRRKVRQLREQMLGSGQTSAADFDRVYAPIGLDLGAQTVPEIAASIVAQMIAVRRKGTAERISLR